MTMARKIYIRPWIQEVSLSENLESPIPREVKVAGKSNKSGQSRTRNTIKFGQSSWWVVVQRVIIIPRSQLYAKLNFNPSPKSNQKHDK